MKASFLVMVVFLSGCGWFHAKKSPPPELPELIVTGAPAGSLLFVDGVKASQPNEAGNRAQVLDVTPGAHTLEVRAGDKVAYREDLDVLAGEKRVVTVLSGAGRN